MISDHLALSLPITGAGFGVSKFRGQAPHVRDWESEPLTVQLSAETGTRPFITFLLVTGRLHPRWEYLVHRKFSSIWRDLPGTVIGQDIEQFITAARTIGYTERVASAMASQVMARVLFATGKRLTEVTHDDFTALAAAGQARQQATGRTWKHYRGTATATKTVLYHHGILPALPDPWLQRQPFTGRLAAVPEPMHSILVRYLERKTLTCKPATVSGLTTRLAHFGAIITELDPQAIPATMTRTRHIEPWMHALTTAANTKSGGILSRPEQARRILAVANFLREITEWDWPEAPARTLMYPSDNPRLPQPLPRFLPPDADRRLTQALRDSRTGCPPTPYCCNAPAASASVSCSTWRWTPSSTSPAPDHGSKSPWANSTPNAWSPSTPTSWP